MLKAVTCLGGSTMPTIEARHGLVMMSTEVGTKSGENKANTIRK